MDETRRPGDPPADLPTPPRPGGDAGMRRALLAWYQGHARTLPWRDHPTPYRVWVAETMLQQTRTDTVRPYFARFVARFPDVHSLARASEDAVLAAWAGLGYYRRARHLHAAAQRIVRDHGGTLPADPAVLQRLPGIGRYTAGAIASIAHGQPVPVLDGNVVRVLCRLDDVAGDPTRAPVRRTLWDRAAGLVPADAPGAFNQALMELGATVCTPRRPRCDDCPVRPWCTAAARGTVAERPVRAPRRRAPVVRLLAAVVRCPRRGLLLVRRPARGILAGLWDVPAVPWTDDAPPTPRDVATLAARRCGLPGQPEGPCRTVRHVLTHRTLAVTAAPVRVDPARPPRLEGWTAHVWAGDAATLRAHAVSRLTHKIVEACAVTLPMGAPPTASTHEDSDARTPRPVAPRR